MIDVIYLLGKGSQWQDNEIRYSLRSLEKYLKDYRKVFIIGHKPDFLNENAIHVPFQDVYTNKARNIMAKVHWMAGDQRMTHEFMMLNDDYFFLKDLSALNYPYYYKCDLTLSSKINHNEYSKHCEATLTTLTQAGLKTKNFDVHRPIIFHKFKLKQMCSKFNWHIKYGYILKSMYCNYWNIEGILEEDVKISRQIPVNIIQKLNENREVFSVGDQALNQSMKAYLMNAFPTKSKFEY